MANKNKHVVIGFFPGKEAASEAVKKLKAWDKANDDIKLGGIGILMWENGKMKTRKVGNRAAGTGAKWGLILGAVTGILSGGVTLLGGALAGVAGGAVLGAMFHKQLGLTDADKQRLEQHLQGGGAAIVVMADESEVQPTMAELASLGGRVENYQVPEETMDQVEESTDIAPVEGQAENHVDERAEVAEEDIPAIVGLKGGIQTVEGVGPARAAALAAIGITTRQALLERGATAEGRAEIASQSQISEKLISRWVSITDLSRVGGIGAKNGSLLHAAGVATVGDLANQDPASLHERMTAANVDEKHVSAIPGAPQIEAWIGKAKELPQAVSN
jgi:uncharacterized membrane protein